MRILTVLEAIRGCKILTVFEFIAWLLSMGSAVIFALTVPNPPLMYLYPMWFANVTIFGIAAYKRGSRWMTVNYIMLLCIDVVGFMRLIL